LPKELKFWELYIAELLAYEEISEAIYIPILKASGLGILKPIATIEKGKFISYPSANKSANPLISKHYLTEEFKDEVFSVLVDKKQQQANFKFLYKSVNNVNPISEEAYFKKAIKQKVPIYDTAKTGKLHKVIDYKTVNLKTSISDEVMMENIVAGTRKEYNLLTGRYNKMVSLQSNISFDNLDSTISSVNNIINTSTTKINNLSAEIRKQQRRLKLANVNDKEQVLNKINALKAEREVLKVGQAEVKAQLKIFSNGKYKTKAELKKAFSGLSNTIKNDLSKTQTRVAYESVMRKQLSKISGTVQTEMMRAKNLVEHTKGKLLALNKGVQVMVRINLNPAHDIIDICDDMHGYYTWEEYSNDYFPPPYHKNCRCYITTTTIKKER